MEWICDVERPPRRQRLPLVKFPRGQAIYNEGDPANRLFIIKSGKVKIETTKKYKLADAAQAHRDLEGRKTTGSIILVP